MAEKKSKNTILAKIIATPLKHGTQNHHIKKKQHLYCNECKFQLEHKTSAFYSLFFLKAWIFFSLNAARHKLLAPL